MRYSLLRDSEEKLWLFNCRRSNGTIEAGLAVGFNGLPASILLYTENDKEICRIEIPEEWQQLITSAAEPDVDFSIKN